MTILDLRTFIHQTVSADDFKQSLADNVKFIVTKWGRRRILPHSPKVKGSLSFKQFKKILHTHSYNTKKYTSDLDRILFFRNNRKVLSDFNKSGYKLVRQKNLLVRIFHKLLSFLGTLKGSSDLKINYSSQLKFKTMYLSNFIESDTAFKSSLDAFQGLFGDKTLSTSLVKNCLDLKLNPKLVAEEINKTIQEKKDSRAELLRDLLEIESRMLSERNIPLAVTSDNELLLAQLIALNALYAYRYLKQSGELLYFFNKEDLTAYCTASKETGKYFTYKEQAANILTNSATKDLLNNNLKSNSDTTLISQYAKIKELF